MGGPAIDSSALADETTPLMISECHVLIDDFGMSCFNYYIQYMF